MPVMINVVSFRTLTAEANSVMNVAEVVSSGRTIFSKRNIGYGFNVGSFTTVPSWSAVYDNDVCDAAVYNPVIDGTLATGA